VAHLEEVADVIDLIERLQIAAEHGDPAIDAHLTE